jgi:halimadienyl-diphosphate synthase
MFDLTSDARQLLGELDQVAMSNTAYDTAWVARVPEGNGSSAPAFPEALEWLQQRQYPDGSWGSGIAYYHDRVISTLAAVVTLAEHSTDSQYAGAVQRGEQYIQQSMQFLHRDPFETVGFELIFPTLLKKARRLGLDLPDGTGKYTRIRQEKLKKIPKDLIYSREVTTAHSLEFMGGELDVDRTSTLQEGNGSFGNSPSATAYFLSEHGDSAAARQYLAETVDVCGGAARPLHPVEIFNKNWVLYNLDVAGLLDELKEEAKPHLDYIYETWDPQRGVGFSRQYSVPDLDDTAVAFKLLRQAGYNVAPDVFAYYEIGDRFICFPYERNPSLGVHVHLFDALRVCPDSALQPPMVEKALGFYRAQVRNAQWTDKWHTSPFYILSHAVIAAIGYDDDLARDQVKCIIASQHPDGSWGYYGSTSEETAYCLQALMVYHNRVEPVDRAVLYHAAQYLYDNYQTQSYPALWIDKCLYCPTHIVRSAIISALWMYEAIS